MDTFELHFFENQVGKDYYKSQLISLAILRHVCLLVIITTFLFHNVRKVVIFL